MAQALQRPDRENDPYALPKWVITQITLARSGRLAFTLPITLAEAARGRQVRFDDEEVS